MSPWTAKPAGTAYENLLYATPKSAQHDHKVGPQCARVGVAWSQMLIDLEKEQREKMMEEDKEKREEETYSIDPEQFKTMGQMPDLKKEAEKIMKMGEDGAGGGMGGGM